MKKRWRVLTRQCETSVNNKTRLTWALIILHNLIILKFGGFDEEEETEAEEEDEEEEEEEAIAHLDDTYSRAVNRREELMMQLWLDSQAP